MKRSFVILGIIFLVIVLGAIGIGFVASVLDAALAIGLAAFVIVAAVVVLSLAGPLIGKASQEGAKMPQAEANRIIAIRVLRLGLVGAAAVLGSMIVWQLEPHRPAPMDARVAEVLGGAIPPFIVSVLPAVFIKSWWGLILGFLIICFMDYVVAQGILSR